MESSIHYQTKSIGRSQNELKINLNRCERINHQ